MHVGPADPGLIGRDRRVDVRAPADRSSPVQVSTIVRTPVYGDDGQVTLNQKFSVAFAGIRSGTLAPEMEKPEVVAVIAEIVQAAVPPFKVELPVTSYSNSTIWPSLALNPVSVAPANPQTSLGDW